MTHAWRFNAEPYETSIECKNHHPEKYIPYDKYIKNKNLRENEKNKMEIEYANLYEIWFWNKDDEYKRCEQNIYTRGDAETEFSYYSNEYDNVQLVEIVRTAIKHKKYI